MITIIFGNIGAGKTALLTRFAVELMTGQKAFEAVQKSKQTVRRLNKGGFNLSPPARHLVFANYAIETSGLGYPKAHSYMIDPFRLGFANNEKSVYFLPPYATIFITEGQKYFDSRKLKALPDWQSRWFEASRQNGHDLFIDCQRIKLIDLNIRELAERVIYVVGIRHRLDRYKKPVRTVWHCREYSGAAEALKYHDEGRAEKGGKALNLSYEGNIFACYDSFAMQPLFLDGHYDKTEYHDEESERVKAGSSIAAIKAFNAHHSYLKKGVNR